MSLADHLEYPAADEPEYKPRTEFDGASGYIQTGPLKSAPSDFDELLRQFGYDPTQVRIVGHPRVSRWQQRSRKLEKSEDGERLIKTSEFETVWLEAYRFHLAPVGGVTATDLEGLVNSAKPPKDSKDGGAYWFVFQAGDLQIGKRSRDGSTEQIIERYVQSVEAAKRELKACKRLGIAGVQISMPGDCIEGNQSQGGKNLWLTQETVTEQARILRRLMLLTVDEFRTIATHVYLDVVGGNHDDADRQQNSYPGNNWATEQAIAVHDAIQLNPDAYGHVQVRVPQKWSGMMTVPVGDTNVCIVHGHQWRRNGAMKWWADQALGMQPAGGAQVLQHGHWHTYEVESTADRMRVASPTFDCGSDWFRNNRGGTSKRGALVYLLRSGEVSRLSVV